MKRFENNPKPCIALFKISEIIFSTWLTCQITKLVMTFQANVIFFIDYNHHKEIREKKPNNIVWEKFNTIILLYYMIFKYFLGTSLH